MRARRGLHRVCGQQTFLLCALPSREDPRLPQGHQLPSRRVGGGERPRSWTLGSVSSGLISKHIFLLGLDDLADSNRLCFPFHSAGSVASAGSLVLFLLPGSEARGPFPPAALEAPLWLCRLLARLARRWELGERACGVLVGTAPWVPPQPRLCRPPQGGVKGRKHRHSLSRLRSSVMKVMNGDGSG